MQSATIYIPTSGLTLNILSQIISQPSRCVSIQHSIISFTLFLYPVLLPGCFTVLVFPFFIYVCVRVCVIVSGVFHYRAPQGRNPLLCFFYCGHRCLFFGVKNNNQVVGGASCLLCFNCISVSVPNESRRRTEAETQAAGTCNVWRSPLGLQESDRGVYLWA